MTRHGRRTVSQRDFLRHVKETAPDVHYAYPGHFSTETHQLMVLPQGDRIGTFLGKLGGLMPFSAYDRLSRSVWVAHWRAQSPHSAFLPEP